jgi:hypothetical protein
MEKKTYLHLLNRRQFFYGPLKSDQQGWAFTQMPGGKWLSTHPELNSVQVSENGFQATLIGFLLDPFKPVSSDRDILLDLCRNSKSVAQFMELTEPLGGRWSIFLAFRNQTIIFGDAAGTRTVFYCRDGKGDFWLASQPGILADKFGFKESAESLEYRQSPEFVKKVEAWWPGECTPYREVKKLVPNHLLHLTDGKVERYWPHKHLERFNLQEGAQKAAGILKGEIEAAHHRYPLAMSLSSGIDSRTVFSACKEFAKEMLVFSLTYRQLTDESDDVRVPREISEKLGLNLKVFDCRQYNDPDFREVFDRNVKGLKVDWAQIAQARVENIPADRKILKGSMSEIMRCRYWNLGVYPRQVTLEDLVTSMGLGSSRLVVDNLKQWMADALPAEKFGMKLLDLLSWEIEVGNWYALGHTVFDIAQEDLTPFNNRLFYATMLGIHPRYRSYPKHLAQREIVKCLWPELGDFPYTPARKIPKRHVVLDGLRKIYRKTKKVFSA